jgi:hypothetical protein
VYANTAGRSIEFVATFSGDANQLAGLNRARFITTAAGMSVQTVGTTTVTTAISGNWMKLPHRFRVDVNPTTVVYSIDGSVVATHTMALTSTQTMTVIASDTTAGAGVLLVDWMRLRPSATAGSYTSSIYDATASMTWVSASWLADLPAGTSANVEVRTGDTPVPDASWTAYVTVPASDGAIGTQGRYVQYRVKLASSSGTVTPVLKDVVVKYGPR